MTAPRLPSPTTAPRPPSTTTAPRPPSPIIHLAMLMPRRLATTRWRSAAATSMTSFHLDYDHAARRRRPQQVCRPLVLMLSSDSDGERLAATAAIGRILKSNRQRLVPCRAWFEYVLLGSSPRAGRGGRGLRVRGRRAGARRRRRGAQEDAGEGEPAADEPRGGRRRGLMAAMRYREALNQALREEMEARRVGLHHGRGRGRVPGRLQGHRGPARGVRREARARHADLREHDRRHGRRRRDGRAAAGGRDHDRELRAAGHGPDRQPRGRDPLHVRRPGEGAAGGPHAAGRRPPARPHPLPQLRGLLPPRARPARGRAVHRRRTPRAC